MWAYKCFHVIQQTSCIQTSAFYFEHLQYQWRKVLHFLHHFVALHTICNLQFICQESVLSLVGLTGFTMKYQSYCLSGVTSIMTVGKVRGWLYSQPFCYSSPSPGTLVVCSILCQRNEYTKTYKCPKNHKAMCIS